MFVSFCVLDIRRLPFNFFFLLACQVLQMERIYRFLYIPIYGIVIQKCDLERPSAPTSSSSSSSSYRRSHTYTYYLLLCYVFIYRRARRSITSTAHRMFAGTCILLYIICLIIYIRIFICSFVCICAKP